MIKPPPPLRPPLRKPGLAAKPFRIPAEKFAPSPKPAPAPAAAIAAEFARAPESNKSNHDEKPPLPMPPKEVFCRQCDKRVQGNPAGWWRLNRFVLEGSLPPPWHKTRHQPMGFYCSLLCLLESLPRLELLEKELVRRGVGMKALRPGEQPPELPAPAAKGGPE